MEDYISLITELARIIQRIEKEGYDITENDIKTVWKVKTKLGYTHPISIEEGTGSMIQSYKFDEEFLRTSSNNFNYKPLYFDTNNNVCDKCPNNFKNGGSGICNCLYGSPQITC